MALILRHHKNKKGRDFIVGDLHGCLWHLERLLDKARFDSACDRVFSTGDLADRGPDSPGCLRLLKEEWFYPVLGNHDQCLLHFLKGLEEGKGSTQAEEALDILFHNGGDWIHETLKPLLLQMPDLRMALETMPLIRSIGDVGDTKRFHVAHGDLYLNTSVLTDSALDTLPLDPSWEEPLDAIDGLTRDELTRHVTWSRRLFKNPGHLGEIPEMRPLSRTYVGHSITPTPRRIASHVFIDGGAYLPRRPGSTYGLHLVDHTNERLYWTDGFDVRQSPLFHATLDPSSACTQVH